MAPLAARQDIAVLGLIHGTVIGKGPNHFRECFKACDGRHLEDPRQTSKGHLITRSARGLVAVYNMFPAGITSAPNVSTFQCRLQMGMKLRAEAGLPTWSNTYSPRVPLHQHPLKVHDGNAALVAKHLDRFFEDRLIQNILDTQNILLIKIYKIYKMYKICIMEFIYTTKLKLVFVFAFVFEVPFLQRSRVLQSTWDDCPSRRYVPKVSIGAFPRVQVELGAIMIRS